LAAIAGTLKAVPNVRIDASVAHITALRTGEDDFFIFISPQQPGKSDYKPKGLKTAHGSRGSFKTAHSEYAH
jgi:hypothetical protein